jgi:hypothetical protein
MWTNHAFTHSYVISHFTVFSYSCQALDTYMASNQTVPRNNWTVDVSIVFDFSMRNNTAVRQSYSFSDFTVRSNSNIRTNFTVRPNCWSFINANIAWFVLWMSVDMVIVKEGSLCFKVVCRLSNIIPEIIFDWQGIELPLLSQLRVDFSLNHTESLRNSF